MNFINDNIEIVSHSLKTQDRTIAYIFVGIMAVVIIYSIYLEYRRIK